MENNIRVGIVGAGIQGVSNALFLQKKGFNVTIFDRDNPGSTAASYGNAGHFSPYASVPLNRTDVLADVPAMLTSSSGPLALKWNYVPKMIPWFVKFIMNCTNKNMMHTAKNMHQILDLALPAYDELFEEIDLEGLVENKGILYIWNDKDLKSRELEINIRNELGVEQQLVNKSEIHDLEPHIKPFYHAGVYYPYARHARNPKKILLKLFDLFLQKGGKFNKVNIKDINFDEEKPIFKTETQSYIFDKAVNIQDIGIQVSIQRGDGKNLEIDIIAESNDDSILLIEVKKRKKKTAINDIEDFLEKVELYKNLNPEQTVFAGFLSLGGFSDEALQMCEQNCIGWAEEFSYF